MGKLFALAFENNHENDSFNDIMSILEDHEILHTNKDLHITISSDVDTLSKMETDFHNQINVSFESYRNNSIALESVIESLKEFWDKIVAFLKSIIEKIVEFFQAHFGLLSRRKTHILKLIDDYNELEMGSMKYEETNNTFRIDDSEWLYVDSKPCDTGSKLLDGIKGLIKHTNFIFSDYLLTVIKRGELIETSISQMKNNKDNTKLKDFKDDFLNHGVKEFEISLLNNKTFSLKTPKIENDLSFKDTIKQLGIIKVEITDTIEIPKKQNIIIKNIQVSEAKNILSELLTLIDEFESFNKTRYKEVLKVGDRIRDDSDNLMKRIESMFKEDSDNHEQLTSIRALVSLNPAYVRWVKTPTTELIHIGTECTFHTCTLLEKNIDLYNKRTALNIFSVMGIEL